MLHSDKWVFQVKQPTGYEQTTEVNLAESTNPFLWMGSTQNVMKTWRHRRNLHLKKANGHPFPDIPAWHWDVLYHQHHATSDPFLYCFHPLVPCQSKRCIIGDLHACFHGNSMRGHSTGAAARNKGHDSEQAQELWMQVGLSAELDISNKNSTPGHITLH